MALDMNLVKIGSLNANGLGNFEKRKDVFQYLREHGDDLSLIFVQEAHLLTSDQNFIRSQWGFECVVNGVSSNSKGTLILFNNNFSYKLHKVVRGEGGQYIVLDIEMAGRRLTVVNLYGPSDRDCPSFFEKICEELDNFDNDNFIIGGDWNVVLDAVKDTCHYRNVNRPRAMETVHDMMSVYNLVDVWREMNPNRRQYTWRRTNGKQRGRLDYFLVSEHMLSEISIAKIHPGYRTDHSLVSIVLGKASQHRMRPHWKWNSSLIKDKVYVDMVKQLICTVKERYAAMVYDFDMLDRVKNEDIQFVISDQLFMETLLLEIRGATIYHASYKKKLEVEMEEALILEVADLEKKGSLSDEDIVTLERKKQALADVRKKKVDGMILRSRAKWIQEGEKATHYFCNLEKRNFVNKSMNVLEREDGTVIKNKNDILKETCDFYEKLYASREAEVKNVNLASIIDAPTLSDEDRDSLEGLITAEEALKALKNMKQSRAPGNDGFTAEFYKFFWLDIGAFVLRSINEGFLTGKMSITQRQGLITCIPKEGEGKNKRLLRHWRPLTLLNVIYKIASACIAERLKNVLPSIIHGDQTGFLKGRYIGENIRLIYDVLVHTRVNRIPGLLLLVDLEKAFDSVAWSFVDKCLDFFNFGPDLKRWIKTFFTDIVACVSVNGQYSKWFNIERGCRQGDPSSPYIYLICAEVLSTLIRNNKEIKGLKINEIEILLSQFADDTSLFLDGTEKSFTECIGVLNYFASISGLKVNYEKTQVVWIGSRTNSGMRFMRDSNFIWNPGVFKVLGVKFSTDIDQIVHLNFENKLTEIRRLLMLWSKRNLTPFGKITVIKTLALSKLVHLFITLPDPSNQFMADLHNMFYSFLWDRKQAKVDKRTICADYESGGLKMVNVYHFLTAMKINWIRRVFHDDSLFIRLLLSTCPSFRQLNVFGGEYANVVMNRCNNNFWCDVLKHLKKLYCKNLLEHFGDFVSEPLFYNIHIIRGRHVVYIREWFDCGITVVGHLLDSTGEFLTFEQFRAKFPLLRVNFLVYAGVINAVKAYKQRCALDTVADCAISECKAWSLVMGGSKVVYPALVKLSGLHTCTSKWNDQFQDLPAWKFIFRKYIKTTQDAKLRWFQFRLIYRLIPTNRFLHLRKLSDSALCTFCGNAEETLTHLFWECPHVRNFWNVLQNWLRQNCENCATLVLSQVFTMFGVENNFRSDKVIDLIMLLARFYIYKCKLEKKMPDMDAFIPIVKRRYNIERYCYSINGQLHKFIMEWFPYESLVT